jgi:CBS domain-containing protein
MDCATVMKRNVQCVRPDDSLYEAANRMRTANIGFLPVCMHDGMPVGVLTDRDLVIRGMAAGLPGTAAVKDVMTPGALVCVSFRASLDRAEDLMIRHQVSRVLCVDDAGHVVGVISLSDIPSHDTSERTKRVFAGVAEREARP